MPRNRTSFVEAESPQLRRDAWRKTDNKFMSVLEEQSEEQ